ncbi:MAG: hypothetical protein HWD92_07110 [Flavobacteriia bacterium]|nr:hypothetical protein [Flavobacteriia bacterium]
MFRIEDDIHAELQEGHFETFEQALQALKVRAEIPYDQAPNACPCTSWMNCERQYRIIDYGNNNSTLKNLKDPIILTISANGVTWNEEIRTLYNLG